MTFVIKHALRAKASMFGSFRPEGWHPSLQVVLMGPSPAGAELVWTVSRPDGSPWFEHRVDAPELAAGEMSTVDLQRWQDGDDIDEAGPASFTLRVVSELDGIDESLHTGSLTAVALDGEHRYAVDADWLLQTALICLDTVDEYDGPKLKVTTFLKGEVDAYQVEAHCFRDGTRFAQASDVTDRHTFTANDGAVIGREFVAEFDTVRGWNNLTAQGWGGDDWHLLDTADGAYEVKFVRERKVVRVVSFTVADGLIVSTGAVEFDPWTGPVMIADAEVLGDLDGPWDAAASEPFYGDPATAALWCGIDDMYSQRTSTNTPGTDMELDYDSQEAMQRFFDRAERLINTWADDMENGTPPFEFSDILQAEAVMREIPDFQTLRDAASAVPDDHAVELNGEPTTIGAMYTRVIRMSERAQQRISGSEQESEDALAPYRELLSHDKLAVFEDHPAPDFRYYTTGKKIIESPEELAEAKFWYFEGTSETRGTGTVDGTSIKVVVEGWRVLGWKFDGDGNTLDEFEEQGQGANAPKSAFAHE